MNIGVTCQARERGTGDAEADPVAENERERPGDEAHGRERVLRGLAALHRQPTMDQPGRDSGDGHDRCEHTTELRATSR